MNLGALLEVGVQALSRNRLRSALTVLGIVIGVAAVIATLAIGQGARAAVQAQIRALGSTAVIPMSPACSESVRTSVATPSVIPVLTGIATGLPPRST